MCASHSVLNRPERRNESKVDWVTILISVTRSMWARNRVRRSNGPPASLIVELAEL